MELFNIRYVVAVAEKGNFTQAAEQCHVGQPALSQQIAKLEGELGLKLFYRDPHSVTLTEAGVCLPGYGGTALYRAAHDAGGRGQLSEHDGG